MISSILTPVRWYNSIAEQDRYSNDCEICDFELISDKTRLLPFQFKRPASGYMIDKWFLRKSCVNFEQPIIDTNSSQFILDDAFWDFTGFYFDNGKLKTTSAPGSGTCDKSLMFTIGKKYKLKIIVSEFFKTVGSSFALNFSYRISDSINITGAGTYSVEFTADKLALNIGYTSKLLTDFVTFDLIQVYEIQEFSTVLGDIDLPTSLLTMANVGADDIIQYVGDAFQFQIPCGTYYMVMLTDDGNYFSELITVKDFIPSQSPYTLIEWFNSCNVSDVIYQPLYGSEYVNRLYIDGNLAKPIYPFKEEGEEDGNNKLNVLFQKWEKQTSLMVAKCPEFIVDSLTAIRLHDTITITKKLAKNQTELQHYFEVEKIETTLTQVFNDCATNTELIITLTDKVIDSTCCTALVLPTCKACDYSVSALDTISGDYYFGTPPSLEYGIYAVTYDIGTGDPIFTSVGGDNTLVCVASSPENPYLYLNGEYWTQTPSFNAMACTQDAANFYLRGFSRTDDSFIKITVGYSNLGTPTFYEIPVIYTSGDFYAGVTISKSSLPAASLVVGENIEFYLANYKLNCDYGTTPDPFVFVVS